MLAEKSEVFARYFYSSSGNYITTYRAITKAWTRYRMGAKMCIRIWNELVAVSVDAEPNRTTTTKQTQTKSIITTITRSTEWHTNYLIRIDRHKSGIKIEMWTEKSTNGVEEWCPVAKPIAPYRWMAAGGWTEFFQERLRCLASFCRFRQIFSRAACYLFRCYIFTSVHLAFMGKSCTHYTLWMVFRGCWSKIELLYSIVMPMYGIRTGYSCNAAISLKLSSSKKIWICGEKIPDT